MSAAEGASKASSPEEAHRMSGVNGQVSGPVLTSQFLFVPDHSAELVDQLTWWKLSKLLIVCLFHFMDMMNV